MSSASSAMKADILIKSGLFPVTVYIKGPSLNMYFSHTDT